MQALTRSNQQSTFDSYYSQTDQAELVRLRNLSAGQGVGDTLNAETDEELVGFMVDMGIVEGPKND